MPIFAGSRYQGLAFTAIKGSDDIAKKFLHLRLPPSYQSQVQREILPGEELDYLAYHYSGQSRQWWRIAEANKLFWPLEIPNGTRLDIPF